MRKSWELVLRLITRGGIKAEVSGLTEDELTGWKQENNISVSIQPLEEIIKQIEEEIKEVKVTETAKEETKEEENKQDTQTTNLENVSNQIYKVVNVSNSSYMMDACFNPTCWDDLDADPTEDRDLGGIYTLGKVYGNGEGFRSGFRPSDLKSNQSAEILANSYKITVYFAIAPFEGPKHKTIDYGTWENHSVEIQANYGDEPVIEWDGSSLRQVK